MILEPPSSIGQGEPVNGNGLAICPLKDRQPISTETIDHVSYSKTGLAVYSTTGILQTQLAIVTPQVQSRLDLRLEKIPIETLQLGQVTVRIAWTGLCASDIYFSTGRHSVKHGHKNIAGHEGIGHIVRSHDPSQLGQAVAMRFLAYSCGSCTYCLKGIPENCQEKLCFPTDHNGTYQQFINVPSKMLTPIPAWVFEHPNPAVYTAALCSGSAALKALKNANIRPKDVVVVLGIGGQIGHLAGLMAKNVYNARVIGIDLAEKENSTAVSLASDTFIPFNGEGAHQNLSSRISSACSRLRQDGRHQRKADAVIVASCTAASYQNLPTYVCDGGSIVFVGAPSGVVEYNIVEVLERQLTIKGSLMGGAQESYQVMEYIRAGLISPKITEIELEDIPRYLGDFNQYKNEGKVVARVMGQL